jgi:hypothetical protein
MIIASLSVTSTYGGKVAGHRRLSDFKDLRLRLADVVVNLSNRINAKALR